MNETRNQGSSQDQTAETNREIEREEMPATTVEQTTPQFEPNAWEDYPVTEPLRSNILHLSTSSEFQRVHDLIYQIFRSTERSKRVLNLTSSAIKLNASNPTTWMLRRQVVIALAKSEGISVWRQELPFTASIITKSSKNYQAWDHRRLCAVEANSLHTEIEFTDIVLAESPKNYHAWSYRQWLVRDHGLIDRELEATKWYIQDDIRDNSAWNHRWVVTGLVQGARGIDELRFALEIMREAPRNRSVWNYIHSLGKHGVCIDEAKQAAIQCIQADHKCVPARRFLILNGKAEEAADIKKHCELLAEEVDPVRKNYWLAQADIADAIWHKLGR